MSYRYQVTLSDEAHARLEEMVASGMWGRTSAEAIKNLVYEAFRSEDDLLKAIFGKLARRVRVKVQS